MAECIPSRRPTLWQAEHVDVLKVRANSIERQLLGDDDDDALLSRALVEHAVRAVRVVAHERVRLNLHNHAARSDLRYQWVVGRQQRQMVLFAHSLIDLALLPGDDDEHLVPRTFVRRS